MASAIEISRSLDTEPGYGQLLGVLVRRRLWLLGVLGSVVAASVGLTLVTRPTYQSNMQLLVEPNYQSKSTGAGTENQFADANVEVDNATQLSLMRSSHLLQRAVDRLQADYPDLTVDKLRKNLTVTQVTEQRGSDKLNTKIFQVTYIDNDAIKTRKVLQQIQKVYQDYNLEQQKLRLTKGLSFINEQLPQVEQKVNQAEANLEAFRKTHNLINPELQAKALVDALSNVQQERRTNQAQLRDAQARYQALQQQLNRSPRQSLIAARLSQSTRYQSLLNEIQKTEIALVQQRVRFKDKVPFVQQLIDQRQRQQNLLQQEVSRVLGPGVRAGVAGNLDQLGQLGQLDLDLASRLVQAQVDWNAFLARDRSLATTERQIQSNLKNFPSLLSEYNRLQPAVEVNRETLQQLLKARQELGLEIARGGFDWQMVEEPQLGNQIAPNLKRNLLLGMAAGLMLGCVAAFIREGLDDAVRTSDDLKRIPLPLLGTVPQLALAEDVPALSLPFQKTPTLATDPMQVIHWPPFREAMDLVYKNIQLHHHTTPLKSLVITSTLTDEGKSTVALGLAISAARLHQRVLLIDADLRSPSLHEYLDLPNDRGLSTLLMKEGPLSGQSGIQPAGRYSDISISVLTAGPVAEDPAKLLSSRRMADLLHLFEQRYDLVIVDAAPVLGIVDAVLTASFCQGVLLVGRMGHVTRNQLQQAGIILSRLNGIGVVANGVEP